MIRPIAEVTVRQEGLRRDWRTRDEPVVAGEIIDIGGRGAPGAATWFWGRLARTVDSVGDHADYTTWGAHARVVRQAVGSPAGASGPPTLQDSGATELICYLDPDRIAAVAAASTTYAALLDVGDTYRIVVQAGYRWLMLP